MSEKLKKADFYLETEEYDKAEKIYSELFDEDDKEVQSIIGIILTKIYQSNFERNQFKATNAYLNKLELIKLSDEERSKLVRGILDATDKYLDKVLTKFRDHALELTKRPALDGQLYSVKKLGDTTDYLGYINDNVDKLEVGISFAEVTYDIAKDKDKTAFKILKLHDKVFQSFRETPQMTGKTLLDANGLQDLKSQRKKWLQKSGEHKEKVQADPSDSSGCLVLVVSLAGLLSSSLILTIIFII